MKAYREELLEISQELNGGISSDKEGENPSRRKSKGSWAR
jgi:hypothetical protein